MRIHYFMLPSLLLLGTVAARAQAALAKLGSVTMPSYGTELVVDGTTAYVLTASAGQQGLRIYDMSTPAAPRLLSAIALPNAGNLSALPPRHAVVSNGLLCVTSYHSNLTTPHFGALWTVDVRNPASPAVRTADIVVGEEDFIAATGDYIYVVPDDRNQAYVYNRTPMVASSGYTYLAQERTIDLPYSLSGIIGLNLTGTTAYVQYANAVFATLDVRNPAQPISSPGTMPGTIRAASGTLAAGLAQSVYAGSIPSNTLRFYSLSNPLQPTLVQSRAGNYGTRLAAGTQTVFTCGETSPFISAAPSSAEPLRGYFMASSASTPLEAVAMGTQGANALVAANNMAYVLTDNELSIYAFPTIVTATRGVATLAPLTLYPNPASRTVQLSQVTSSSSVTVYDLTGRICLQAKLPASGTLDISGLPAGLYQVHTGTAIGKLTIQ
ncbi:T9SS type A sorting domain-containing protein [Hymenobacter cheonanensis]|uniref:T9SS type A sorting domain-containing protein n=1 Tax=Hymenobacter sp. CA2-7 TaxID=3063993 RepID=UPI00271250A3|nr:T9SS type A sorting domain-containing protein [Hymenobacter sp. CA2-7]MDO7886011.1 T9SS type A sorting domain-containing protein [Hymenobacter sp. CA2-7]